MITDTQKAMNWILIKKYIQIFCKINVNVIDRTTPANQTFCLVVNLTLYVILFDRLFAFSYQLAICHIRVCKQTADSRSIANFQP